MSREQSLVQQWREDYNAHGRDATLPGFRAVAVHRFGVWRLGVRPRLVRAPLTILYRRFFRRYRNRYGIELPHSVALGRRVRIEHQGGIVVHGSAVIGDDVIIRQGVTIGNRHLDRPHEAPVIGNRVNIGSGAVILGGITIGDDVSIGANAVVLDNVPAGSTVVGPRAAIRPRRLSMTSAKSPSVTVAVCTFRRNAALAALIRTIDGLAPNELPQGSMRMLVVDDSPEGAATATVDTERARVAVTLDREASAAADIAIARNHALASGSRDSDFVACLDDDCVPHEGWLRELLRIAAEHQADIVVGHRQFVAAAEAPRWLREQPFLAENLSYADGSVPVRGNTANMLVRSAWLNSAGVRFRNSMGQVGGEDMVFFADATAAGANIRFAAHSLCDEPSDGRRATLRYQLWRQTWLGNNEAAISRTTGEASRARLVARGTKRMVVATIRPFGRILRRQSPQWRWSLATIGRGAGLLLGVGGLRMRHRS